MSDDSIDESLDDSGSYSGSGSDDYIAPQYNRTEEYYHEETAHTTPQYNRTEEYYHEEFVDLTPDNERAVELVNLGDRFRDEYRQQGDLPNLEAALKAFQEAVEQTPEADPDLASRICNVGTCFSDRYRRLGNLDDLETALKKFQTALGLTPNGNPQQAWFLQNIGICYCQRYQILGDLNDSQAALAAFQKALDVADEPDFILAQTLREMGVCFAERYRRLGDSSDLNPALKKFEESVEFTPRGHPDLAGHMRNLGTCFSDRYDMAGSLNDLEAAVKHFHEAVRLTPDGHPDLAGHLQCLGSGLSDRYRRLGDLKDLEAALTALQQAFDLTPADHPYVERVIQGLGLCLLDRYRRLGNVNDVEEATNQFQRAVKLTPEGHPDLAGHMRNLGSCFLELYQNVGGSKNFGGWTNLELAIDKFQEAARLTPKGHRDLAGHLRNLGICYSEQYRRQRDMKDLDAASKTFQEALSLTAKGHPDTVGLLQAVAVCFTYRYLRVRDPNDLEAVHSYYSSSFNTSSPTPEVSWKAALEWASFAEAAGAPQCVSAYFAAFNLLPEILWIGHSILVRHSAVHRLKIGQAAANAIQASTGVPNLTAAIELMEQGMATIFQQTLQLKTDADKLSSCHADEFRSLSFELYSGSTTDPLKVMNIVNRRNNLISQIRQEPAFEYFLLPNPYTVLCEASQGGPVVILNSHKDVCDALIILNPKSNPVHVPLSNVTLELLESRQTTLKQLLARCNARIRAESASTRLFGQQENFTLKTTEECFADMLMWLWNFIVAPIFQVLDSYGIHDGRLWWLPIGAFTGLPLHACPPQDQFIHSYTATLGSLLDAYARKSSSTEHKVSVIGVTHSGSGGLNYLQGVQTEVQKICLIIQKPHAECLEGESATPNAVKQQLADHSWVHLACHEKQDVMEPTKSHLVLYGGILELDTILQMSLSNPQFVFLAACQTAMGDSELVNESFHLAGGFIAAGFRSAVGTLWSMNDQDGPFVADIFYSHLFRDGGTPIVSDTAEATSR